MDVKEHILPFKKWFQGSAVTINGELDVKNTYGFLARSFGQDPETFNAFLQNHGFDGVVDLGVRGVADYSLQFVVFDPNQAKSSQECGDVFQTWVEDDPTITDIMAFLDKEIGALPDGFNGVVKTAKLFGSYLRDKDKANDIDVHVNYSPLKGQSFGG